MMHRTTLRGADAANFDQQKIPTRQKMHILIGKNF